VVVGDDKKWEGYCKIIKSTEVTAIKSQESSPLVEENMKDAERKEPSQIELLSKRDSIEESDASSEHKANEKAAKKSSGKERKRRIGATKKRTTDKDRKGNLKRTSIKVAVQKVKEKSLINEPIPFNVSIIRDNEEAESRMLRREMSFNETNEIGSFPQKRMQTFFIERQEEKKLHVNSKKPKASISQDFTTKLFKAQIDTKKIISFTSLQSENESKKSAIQPKFLELAGQQFFASDVERSMDHIKGLSTRPSVPLECKDHNHIHNDACGHVLVIHDDHIDAIHNGELHYTNRSRRVFPHKLAVSKTNPDVCDPICRTRGAGNEVLEEIITPHVILLSNARMMNVKMRSVGF
jgi:hypothetical protein